ncbi:hypothetical protein, partial [Thiolapillus sp.]|uniref:hypothetical protein n=1 Tax=Thiolapillus sp. TaxID=2017437 RepID=UPI003AF57265
MAGTDASTGTGTGGRWLYHLSLPNRQLRKVCFEFTAEYAVPLLEGMNRGRRFPLLEGLNPYSRFGKHVPLSRGVGLKRK